MAFEIDTAPKRARLRARKNPYWQGVSGGRGGVSLGYRKPSRRAGNWIAKIVVHGQRIEERIGEADDDGAAHNAMSYRTAVAATLEWARQQHGALEARREAVSNKVPTVRSAVEAYVKVRKERSKRDGAITEGRLSLHVLSDKSFADTRLAKMRASTIDEWRNRLSVRAPAAKLALVEAAPVKAKPTPKIGKAECKPKPMAPGTVNRLLNDLRAALNAAAEKHRRELPPHLVAEIKAGTKATSVTTEARRQLLTDAQIRKVVDAAFAVDPDGDFGRLVMLAAVTGARYSQLASLTVGDVQRVHVRVMMPGSKKGRAARARAPVAVPIAPDMLARLAVALDGRDEQEPLLLRWAYRNIGQIRWVKDHRRPLGPAYEVEKLWALTIQRVGLAIDTVMYSLRHSSIVRALRAGLPIRLVAVLHDTSVEMIEAHYSAYIVDVTEDLARRAAISFEVKANFSDAAE